MSRTRLVTVMVAIATTSAHLILILTHSNSTHAAKPSVSAAQGLESWQQVYSVLTHPRCINCHTATAYPQQGDDRHRHNFNVVRGQTGMGVPAFTCAACHQQVNADSTGVPGAAGWHLAPLSMQWQDARDQIKPSPAVCRAVTDR